MRGLPSAPISMGPGRSIKGSKSYIAYAFFKRKRGNQACHWFSSRLILRRPFDRTRRSVVMRSLLSIPGLDERVVCALLREWAAPAVLPSISGELAMQAVDMQVGLRPGGSDSSLAFVIAIDAALKHAVTKWNHLCYGPGIPGVPHAHHFLLIDDLIIASSSVDQAREMYADAERCLRKAGLEVQEAKTQYWCSADVRICHRHAFRLPGTDRSSEGLVVLGAVCHFPHGQGLAVSHRIRSMWAVWNRLRGLLRCQVVPLESRLQVLTSTVTQSGLWGLTVIPLRNRELSRLRAAHLAFLTRMICFRKRRFHENALESWTPWWVEKCRQAYRLAAEAGHSLIDREWASRYWTWSGHIAREQCTFPWQLVQHKPIAWWRQEQQLQSGWRHVGKRGHLWRWEPPLQRWADMHQGKQRPPMPWHVYAANRQTWRDLLPSFLQTLNVRVDRHERQPKRKRKRHWLSHASSGELHVSNSRRDSDVQMMMWTALECVCLAVRSTILASRQKAGTSTILASRQKAGTSTILASRQKAGTSCVPALSSGNSLRRLHVRSRALHQKSVRSGRHLRAKVLHQQQGLWEEHQHKPVQRGHHWQQHCLRLGVCQNLPTTSLTALWKCLRRLHQVPYIDFILDAYSEVQVLFYSSSSLPLTSLTTAM